MIASSKNPAIFATEFKDAKPFEHVIIDDFLDHDFASELSNRFPDIKEVPWWVYNNHLEKKLAFDKLDSLDSVFREFFLYANSDQFVENLRSLSGIKNLIPDPGLRGGGLHMIRRGGKLDIHEDFNIHKSLNAFRKLNLILYLNKEWNPSWGGDLELWNRDMTSCERSISPIMNRAVIFRTDQSSNHGHPRALECPEDRARISLAVYYYEPITDDSDQNFKSTVYKKLPGESNDLDSLRAARALGRIEDKKIETQD